MDDVNLRSVKLMPLQLDVKHNTNKTLSDLIGQLQTASTLKGVVLEVTKDGDAIFTTIYGKFSMPNLVNLQKGDKIDIKILTNNEHFTVKLISVNNIKNEDVKALKLNFMAPPPVINSETKTKLPTSGLDTQNISIPPARITATINYLNLSNVNKNSLIYKALANVPSNIPIAFEVIENQQRSNLSPYQISAEIIDNSDSKDQLIKTAFGILSVKNTDMPVGTKLILEMKMVGTSHINTIPLKTNVENFLFKFNDHWPALKDLAQGLKALNDSQSYIANIKQSPNDRAGFFAAYNHNIGEKLEHDNRKDIMKSLKSPEKKAAFRELSDEFTKIKEAFNPIDLRKDYQNWQSLYMPIFVREDATEDKIFIKRINKDLIRFVIDISSAGLGEIQFDGLIKLRENNILESFDLAVRFKNTLNTQIQNIISDIYLANQNISGIRGVLNFEQVDEFPVNAKL